MRSQEDKIAELKSTLEAMKKDTASIAQYIDNALSNIDTRDTSMLVNELTVIAERCYVKTDYVAHVLKTEIVPLMKQE